MIALYIIFTLLGLGSYLIFNKIPFGQRLLIAILVFAVPSAIFTILVLINGDKATPNSRTISKEELEREGKSKEEFERKEK